MLFSALNKHQLLTETVISHSSRPYLNTQKLLCEGLVLQDFHTLNIVMKRNMIIWIYF